MGYWYNFGTSSNALQQVLEKLDNALASAGTKPDGSFDINITVNGNSEEKVNFSAQNIDELRNMLKMNSGKME